MVELGGGPWEGQNSREEALIRQFEGFPPEQTQRRTAVAARAPEPFKSGMFSEWWRRFYIYAQAAGWGRREIMDNLPALLSGPAETTVMELSPAERRSIEAVARALFRRFESAVDRRQQRSLFGGRGLLPGEALEEYMDSLVRLFRAGEPDAPRARVRERCIERFCLGLPPAVGDAVWASEGVHSCEDAVSRAKLLLQIAKQRAEAATTQRPVAALSPERSELSGSEDGRAGPGQFAGAAAGGPGGWPPYVGDGGGGRGVAGGEYRGDVPWGAGPRMPPEAAGGWLGQRGGLGDGRGAAGMLAGEGGPHATPLESVSGSWSSSMGRGPESWASGRPPSAGSQAGAWFGVDAVEASPSGGMDAVHARLDRLEAMVQQATRRPGGGFDRGPRQFRGGPVHCGVCGGWGHTTRQCNSNFPGSFRMVPRTTPSPLRLEPRGAQDVAPGDERK